MVQATDSAAPSMVRRAPRWLRAVRRRSSWRSAAASSAPLVAGAGVALILQAGGVTTAIEEALGSMGFDLDRAVLIASLVIGVTAAAAGSLPRGASRWSIVAGVGVIVALFWPTFLRETRTAMAAPAAQGRFDPVGWLLTVGVLLVISTASTVAAATLASAARASVCSALAVARDVVRRRAPMRRLLRPAVVVAWLLAIALAAPFFGDLVNYAPDIHLTAGAPPPVGLVGGAPGPGATDPGVNGPASPTDAPTLLPGAGGTPVDSGRPWLAWRPSGVGRLASVTFPGPWTGGTSPTATVWVYTPPGYPDGARRYPVIYEAPWGPNGLDRGAHLIDSMNGLISDGAIPATIMVFVSEGGGPYPDSECINSADGREWFERYLTSTVVPYVDAHFQTIASPAARALFGFSYGGYCAPMLLLRHPDLFSSAISFSGYYEAAIKSSETPTAWRPYAGDAALIAATSPLHEVSVLPAAVRPALFIELSASPGEWFFGPQYQAFAAAVRANRVALALFPTSLGHSWAAVRAELGPTLETLAARETKLGVFTT